MFAARRTDKNLQNSNTFLGAGEAEQTGAFKVLGTIL